MIQTATLEPQSIRETFLPYALPFIGEEEIAEVVDSLRSGWITTGPKVKKFEGAIADYVGTKHAIAVSSCTTGLHAALTALDIGIGDEVIVPTMTFCATANVVAHLGATPILVDVREDGNLNPACVKSAITPQTKAIIPVHYAGQACELEEVYKIARENRLAVIEDAAHGIGGHYRGHKIGSDSLDELAGGIKRVTVFSFYATKNMTTGEGGMITTNDDDLAQTMRMLSLHGMSRDAWKRYTSAGSWYYEVVAPGYKSNMTDIQAALGLHQLKRLDQFVATRQIYAKFYDEEFAAVPEITTPRTHQDRDHIYHLYVLRIDYSKLTIDRGEFVEEMKKRNIGTSVHFIPVHLHPYYQESQGYTRGDCPVAESVYDSMFSLPLYPKMSFADLQEVVDAVKNIISIYKN